MLLEVFDENRLVRFVFLPFMLGYMIHVMSLDVPTEYALRKPFLEFVVTKSILSHVRNSTDTRREWRRAMKRAVILNRV